jgi:predicted  nucleic acid-binding Zn-ribbon protein
MTSTELIMSQVGRLSELELDDLLKEIGHYLSKNNLEHLINNSFDMDGDSTRVLELEEELEDAEDEISRLKSRIQDLEEEIKSKKCA